MTSYVKEAHTAIFAAATKRGKSELACSLLETVYKRHFSKIFLICPTIRDNATYISRRWVYQDENIFLIDPKKNLLEKVKDISDIYRDDPILLIIDDCMTDKAMNKQSSELSLLASSGRHRNQSVWFLTQRYKRIPLTVRDQLQMLFIWYPKNRKELELIHEENDIIPQDKFSEIKQLLKKNKHNCLYLNIEDFTYKVLKPDEFKNQKTFNK
jgi:hypothetical protein